MVVIEVAGVDAEEGSAAGQVILDSGAGYVDQLRGRESVGFPMSTTSNWQLLARQAHNLDVSCSGRALLSQLGTG